MCFKEWFGTNVVNKDVGKIVSEILDHMKYLEDRGLDTKAIEQELFRVFSNDILSLKSKEDQNYVWSKIISLSNSV